MRKAPKYSFVIVMLLLLSGFIYQFIATQIDNKKYLPPGKMIDIGGYRLHLHCIGEREEGKPTVILDAALGGFFSLDWILVQTKVAQFTRVCSYDRAGYGWSEASPKPRTSEYIVAELHQLLNNAKETGPYILVGNSFGGVNMRLFACLYPEQTSGVVLVDASHEDQNEKLPKAPFQSLMDLVIGSPWLNAFVAEIGLVRLFQRYIQGGLLLNFPFDIKKAYLAKISTTNYIKAASSEYSNFTKSLVELKRGCSANNPELGDILLRVITAGKSDFENETSSDWVAWRKERDSAWKILQNDLATKSKNSKHVIAKESGHLIPREQPQIIIDQIRSIIESK